MSESIARPLTVVLLIDGLPGGGAEKVVLTLAAAMARAGHAVTLLSLRAVCEYPVPPGVRYLLVEDRERGPLRRVGEIGRRARALDAALAATFGDAPIDLAISNLPKTDRIVAASKRLKRAWMCLHCALEVGSLAGRSGLKRWIKHRQLLRTYSGRRLITVSAALQDDVRALGIAPARMVTIYNPFEFEAIRAQAAEACPIEGDFVLHVGRFNHQKRHDRLLEAFAQSRFGGRLVLLGSGGAAEVAPVRAQVEALGLADRVVFAGFQANPYPYMRAARALVLSSDYEGFGNVLVEALACGTPVVSTDCPSGPDEILTGPLATGLAELTPEALAAAIDRVLAAPPPIDPAALERFGVDHVTRQYLALAEPT
ncbi:glycosyltransferase [Chitinimonas koreensis]|uniref:glycosyltransferase n=1 Tax=Chitinimonas koreensis TaxID=356302 RepID=UPI0004164266|nr:glycosyltransferase [Chitinimonas koreensis]